jgi:hypothetical protein
MDHSFYLDLFLFLFVNMAILTASAGHWVSIGWVVSKSRYIKEELLGVLGSASTA